MSTTWKQRLHEAGYRVRRPPYYKTGNPYLWIVDTEATRGGCAQFSEQYDWERGGMWVTMDSDGVAMHDHPLFTNPEAAIAYAVLQGWLA